MGSLPYNLDPNKGPVGKFFSGLSLIELEKVDAGPVVHYSPRSSEIPNGQYKDNLYIFQKEIIENHEEVQQFNIPECLHQEQDFQAKAKPNIIAFIQGK